MSDTLRMNGPTRLENKFLFQYILKNIFLHQIFKASTVQL